MTREEITQKVYKILNETLAVNNTQSYMMLQGPELGADSLDIQEILMEFEKTFGIKLEITEKDVYAKNITVGDLIDIIEKRSNND